MERLKAKGERMRVLDGITDSMDINLGKLWEMVRRNREAGHAAVHGAAKSHKVLVTEKQQPRNSW